MLYSKRRIKILPTPSIINVIKVSTRARAADFPQSPCSARLRIFTLARLVLKETRKITELKVPTPRTKS